ncbi:MAG TPA: hypothetical protein VGY31_03710 [Terriglobia bacterium]|nr:hypothetical protein [Terriglobia bacterium]
MTSSTRLTMLVITGSAALAVFCAVLGVMLARWIARRRAKSPDEIERQRRLEVNRVGRITSGEIVDYVERGAAGKQSRVVLYRYEVAGVTYEAAQEIMGFAELPAAGVAGLSSSVKYDPQKPMNSIIACEEWSGFARASDLEAAQT